MTRRFVDGDGTIHTVADAAGLVRALHETAITQSPTDREFMRLMAARVEIMTGLPCRCDTPVAFVADLIRLGVVTEE